jgi:hypothetical protein
MGSLASFIFTSLDGFYEGPNGELDWLIVNQEFNDFATRQLDEADTMYSVGPPMSTWPATGQPSRPTPTIRP